jgi:hypothetical protein
MQQALFFVSSTNPLALLLRPPIYTKTIYLGGGGYIMPGGET